VVVRVLDVNNFYAPSGGGVRTYHERKLRRYRSGGGVTYGLVVPSDRWEEERDGAAFRYHVPAVPIGAGYRQIVTPGGLRAVVEAFRPDVVEMGSPFTLPPLLRSVLRGRDVARVAFYHSDYPDTWWGPGPGRSAGGLGARVRAAAYSAACAHRARAYRDQQRVMVASRFLVERLQGAGLSGVVHTPLGVDTDVFGPERRSRSLREAHGVGEDEKVVLWLGRLSPEKGVRALLELGPLLVREAGVRLVIGGHGPLERSVDAMAAELGDRVIRVPFQASREAVAAWMASADVFLSLCPWETFSLATVEAMASGTPVLGSDRGGVAELMEAVQGGMPWSGEGEGREGVARLRALASWSHSERCGLAERVRQRWSWDVALSRIESVWEGALGEVCG
jgi:alpha-1,6-mannosyltransferase